MRRLGLAGLIAAAAATAAVVGALGSGSAGAAPVKAAAARLDASTSRFTVTMSYEGQTAMMRGQMDYGNRRGMMRWGEDEAVFEAVFDGDTTYTRDLALTELVNAGKAWVRGGTDGWQSFDLDNPAMANPATLLGKLQATGGDVRDLGTETVDGAETRHYAGDAYDAWVEDGVIRRVALRDDGLVTTADFYDFGAPVEIALPAADQVLTEDEMAVLMDEAMKA